jgi:hypothetical protein
MVKKRLKALGSLKSNATKIQLWRQHLVQPPLTQKQVGVDATMGVFLTQQSNQRDVSIPNKKQLGRHGKTRLLPETRLVDILFLWISHPPSTS